MRRGSISQSSDKSGDNLSGEKSFTRINSIKIKRGFCIGRLANNRLLRFVSLVRMPFGFGNAPSPPTHRDDDNCCVRQCKSNRDVVNVRDRDPQQPLSRLRAPSDIGLG
jgi:hypothetical protein